MVKPLILLRPRAMSSSAEEETPRAVPIRRPALIQMCEDGVSSIVSHPNVVASGKTSGSI
jgi:hypothetical protein